MQDDQQISVLPDSNTSLDCQAKSLEGSTKAHEPQGTSELSQESPLSENVEDEPLGVAEQMRADVNESRFTADSPHEIESIITALSEKIELALSELTSREKALSLANEIHSDWQKLEEQRNRTEFQDPLLLSIISLLDDAERELKALDGLSSSIDQADSESHVRIKRIYDSRLASYAEMQSILRHVGVTRLECSAMSMFSPASQSCKSHNGHPDTACNGLVAQSLKPGYCRVDGTILRTEAVAVFGPLQREEKEQSDA